MYICRIAHIKLQKWFTKNIHTKLKWIVVVERERKLDGLFTSVWSTSAYSNLYSPNWTVLTDLMLFVYDFERINQTFTWICSQLMNFIASITWNTTKRHSASNLQTITNPGTNLQSTKHSQFLSSPCSQLLLWDPFVIPMHAWIDQTLVHRPSSFLPLWHYNYPLQLSVNIFW